MVDFVRYPDPLLAQTARHRPLDAAMIEAGEKLLAAALEAKAYGLAAAHIGLIEPVIVISVADDPAKRDYRVMYAPRAVAVSAETESGPEGSVSMPGIEVWVLRPVWVEIAYGSADDGPQTMRLDGFAARVFLHEVDQMEGCFFLNRISRLKRDAAIRKFTKSERVAALSR